MANVLVVDDEAGFCRQLELALGRDGHSVTTADSGQEAIEIGSRMRPDVVVSDWVLGGVIHGLQVYEALRSVQERLNCVLMTGFATDDLRERAEGLEACELLEKPFDLDHMKSAVQRAATHAPPASPSPVAVMETGALGEILYANERARAYLAPNPYGLTLSELLSKEDGARLGECTTRWVQVCERGRTAAQWYVRAREFRGSAHRLYVLVELDRQNLCRLATVRMLLGLPALDASRAAFSGNAIVVDDDPLVRRVSAEMLELLGFLVHAAQSHDEAKDLVRRDASIRLALIDFEMPEGEGSTLANELRDIRPDLQIIGTSGADHREEFRAAGVESYLPKPWVLEDLRLLVEEAG